MDVGTWREGGEGRGRWGRCKATPLFLYKASPMSYLEITLLYMLLFRNQIYHDDSSLCSVSYTY